MLLLLGAFLHRCSSIYESFLSINQWTIYALYGFTCNPFFGRTVGVALVLYMVMPVEFHCRCVVRICSQVLLVI